MKVDCINYGFERKRKVNFNGITQKMPQYSIRTIKDLTDQYELCRYAKFYEALDDKIFPQNKQIRQENFSFLERIPDYLKLKFVWLYRWVTNFPNLTKASEKIEQEFIKQIKNADNSMVKAVIAGYDPVCSVGLRKAFPGSDLDKAYIILDNFGGGNMPEQEIIARYKGVLWHNTDQRILSHNNENTFPEVYTIDQTFDILDRLDRLTRKAGLDKNMDYFLGKREFDINPVSAGEFNIKLARTNDGSEISKVNAKNFAYFIESVRDGKLVYNADDNLYKIITRRISESPFAQMSNVTQMGAHTRLITSHMKPIKTKFKYREFLSMMFGTLPEEQQFEIVKDLVRSVSKDQSQRYSILFKNDDDIGKRFDRLNVLLV